MSATSSQGPVGDVRERFARLLEQSEQGQSVDWEAEFRERPELRVLHDRWLRVEGLLSGLVHDPRAIESALSEIELAAAALDDETRATLERLVRPDRARDRYEQLGELGRGGMGVVTRVRDRDLERELALKTVRTGDGRALERFLREARIAARLEHPGILPVHDVGIDAEGRVFFTMPLVRGCTLAEVLELARAEREGWTLVRVLEVVIKVCDALAFAHALGVVHRDVKPANVLVGRFGEAYVTDWGLAQDARLRDVSSQPGAVLGTVSYMAPEQARGEHERVTPRTDVHALGAILFHVLAGRSPFHAPTEREALERARQGARPALRELAPHAPEELVSIAEKAMAREPADRYRDCAALAEDLRAFLGGHVVRAHERGAWPELRKWFVRNRVPSLLGLLAVLGTLGGLSAALWTQARDEREILRLSDAQRLTELEARADELWPALPARAGELAAWIDDAQALLENLPLHEAALARVRAQAEGSNGAERFVFARTEDRWRHDTLAHLVESLQRWSLPDPARSLLSDVRARSEFARTVEHASLVAPASTWAQAQAEIARSPLTPGLQLDAQLGLVPLGPDPRSGLWEFAHLASGEVPRRSAAGELELQPGSAIVLVLVPGGRFTMGSRGPTRAAGHATSLEPGGAGPLVDLLARSDESPTIELVLEPFFIAKHELTEAQRQRLAGSSRSSRDRPVAEALAPAGTLAWDEARALLARVALDLPTEAQWECAARAGTQTRFWSGIEAGTLTGTVNAGWGSDGAPLHGGEVPAVVAVDLARPNAWGLLHVAGNVAEWVEDEYATTLAVQRRAADGLSVANGSGLRVARGGAYDSSPRDLRSAARAPIAASSRSPSIGVRATRRIQR